MSRGTRRFKKCELKQVTFETYAYEGSVDTAERQYGGLRYIYPQGRAVLKPITQLSGVEKGTFAGVSARLECPLQGDREEDLRTRFSNFADEVQAMKALGASVAGSYCEICPYVGLSKEEAAEVRIRTARQETELMRARAARLLAEKELNDALKEAGLPIE